MLKIKECKLFSNNLANVNTTGFKRDRANFESLLYQVLKLQAHKQLVKPEIFQVLMLELV